jgi:hypothetical protein
MRVITHAVCKTALNLALFSDPLCLEWGWGRIPQIKKNTPHVNHGLSSFEIEYG